VALHRRIAGALEEAPRDDAAREVEPRVVAPREQERPQPVSQVVRVARRLRDSLMRQRPDFQESGQNREEDLTEEDAVWMT
jgi:hypothetical protein